MEGGRIVIAGRNDARETKAFEPGLGQPEFSPGSVLRDVSGDDQRIGLALRDKACDSGKRSFVMSPEMNVRDVQKPHHHSPARAHQRP